MNKLIQALETIRSWNSHTVEYALDYGSNGVRDFYRAIAGQALAEQPAQQEPDALVTSLVAGPDGVILAGLDRELPLMTGVYLAPQPAQPQQEPVAIADGTFNHNCPVGTPLYTSPPALQKPLTLHEIVKLTQGLDLNGISWVDVIRAVETAHGIKERT